MAHECPECGMRCHCNGDIDDIMLPSAKHEAACEHCDHNYDDYPYDDPLECPRCCGSGRVPSREYEAVRGREYRDCPDCHGTGEV